MTVIKNIIMRKKQVFLYLAIITVLIYSCTKDSIPDKYKTKNIIVIVVDGARYSETWGDSTHQFIPYFANEIAKNGIINTEFYNNGATYTLAGHSALTTSNYQQINNTGAEIPIYPSVFQCFLKQKQINANSSWIISSKDKLEILNNCLLNTWSNRFSPSTNCGVNGLGSGYREDSISIVKFQEILTIYHPHLVLFSFRDPDFSAHTGIWNNYIEGIKNTDKYICQIWNFINNDPIYKNSTTLFITNDHGRHLDSVSSGFASHGDTCMGCRHISFFAYGPDFKKSIIINKPRELIDIPATIAELLQFNAVYLRGEVMNELFENK